jgi:hypothetical protein
MKNEEKASAELIELARKIGLRDINKPLPPPDGVGGIELWRAGILSGTRNVESDKPEDE